MVERPAAPTTFEILDGFNIARLDTFGQTPVAMVLERMDVRTAEDLLNLLRLVSIDSALAVLGWAAHESINDERSTLDALRVTLLEHEVI